MSLFKSFGGKPNNRQRSRYEKSPNWREGSFKNLVPTRMNPEGTSFWKIMREVFKKREERRPSASIPNLPIDIDAFQQFRDDAFIWLGHSSLLVKVDGMSMAVDPVFSPTASPFPWIGPKMFDFQFPYTTANLPLIDYLLLTHDHYDHLDYKAVSKLGRTVKKIITPLGVAPHLIRWGIPEDRILEMDWWEEVELEDNIKLTCIPTRHFAGRGIRNRNGTLWGGFALKTNRSNLLLGGDSGYGDHFKEIGDRLGPFDVAFLECGQYNENWPWIHMMPEQTVQAAMDVRAKHFVPMHWGKFSLSLHPWTEPAERAVLESERKGVSIITPKIGELLPLDSIPSNEAWWMQL